MLPTCWQKKVALGETHLSHLEVLFLEETFCLCPCFIFPFFFPAYKQALPLAALICGDDGVSVLPPSPPLPHRLCPLSAPPTPSSKLSREVSWVRLAPRCCWHDAGHPLHPPRAGRASRTCCAGCRSRTSPRAMVRKHPRAPYGADPCSVSKSGHGGTKKNINQPMLTQQSRCCPCKEQQSSSAL